MIAHLDDEEGGERLSSKLSIVSDGTDCAILISDQTCISSESVYGGKPNDGFVLFKLESALCSILTDKTPYSRRFVRSR